MARKVSPELAELRAEIKHSERLVSGKLTRLRKKGIRDTSRIDIRRDPKRVARYNITQARHYLTELNAFRTRQYTFVADAEGKPMSGALFQQYKTLEALYNAQAEASYSKVGKLKIPLYNLTVNEFRSMSEPGHNYRGIDPATNIPDSVHILTPSQFRSEKSLKKKIESLKKRTSPDYRDRMNEIGRKSFIIMARAMSLNDMADMADSLTTRQWDLIWNKLKIAERISHAYEIMKATYGPIKPDEAGIQRDEISEVKELARWARSLSLGG